MFMKARRPHRLDARALTLATRVTPPDQDRPGTVAPDDRGGLHPKQVGRQPPSQARRVRKVTCPLCGFAPSLRPHPKRDLAFIPGWIRLLNHLQVDHADTQTTDIEVDPASEVGTAWAAFLVRRRPSVVEIPNG